MIKTKKIDTVKIDPVVNNKAVDNTVQALF
jgi:hypothetical protein